MTTPQAINFTTPVPTTDDDSVEIKDFTIEWKRIRFRIAPHIYEARPMLGPALMQRMVNIGKTLGSGGEDRDIEASLEGVYSIFSELLLPDSATTFNAELAADKIDIQKQLIPVLFWLLEQYGVRPIQPSPDSSAGSPSETGGTPFTAGASLVESSSVT